MPNENTPKANPENCAWAEKMSTATDIYYWCSLNKTPCRYATRCEYEEKENDNDGEILDELEEEE